MTLAAWVVVALALLVVVGIATLCVARARRLDWLHVRTDAARAALVAALDQRAATAHRAAAGLGPSGAPLHAAAAAARTAAWAEREHAENVLGRRLAAVDRAALPADLAAELSDAEQLVVVARRVHNDAVRDTLELRSRRLVRWLRLAGNAPLPGYFEIADPEPVNPTPAAPERNVGADVRSS